MSIGRPLSKDANRLLPHYRYGSNLFVSKMGW